MIGVFDSGVGGLTAVRELRRISPSVDICFLADRENSPYGTKSRRELTGLVKDNISRLASMGADRILMACCTASTVYSLLPPRMRKISCPIIAPAAMAAARATKCGRVGVIATDATVGSHAFRDEILLRNPHALVTEIATQELVSLVEHPESLTVAEQEDLLDHAATRIADCAPRELILGCTHFSHIRGALADRLPSVRIIDTARIAARRMAEDMINEEIKAPPDSKTRGRGRSIYT